MQEWWNAYAAERLLAGEILAWGAFLAVMFMLIAMASIKYQQAFMTYFGADDVPADEFWACYTDIFEEYADGSSLTVSNIPQAAHPQIPQLPIYNAPPESTVAHLCSLHQAIRCKTRPTEPLAPNDDEPYSRRILYWLGRQREYLAQMGLVRAKPDIDGRYYYTWKGAASVMLRSFPVFRSLFVRARRRKTASLAEE